MYNEEYLIAFRRLLEGVDASPPSERKEMAVLLRTRMLSLTEELLALARKAE